MQDTDLSHIASNETVKVTRSRTRQMQRRKLEDYEDSTDMATTANRHERFRANVGSAIPGARHHPIQKSQTKLSTRSNKLKIEENGIDGIAVAAASDYLPGKTQAVNS